VTQEPEIQLQLNMVHIVSVRRQAQSLQRWIQAKMCYQEQPLSFLLPLTNIIFKLNFKNITPIVAYDASLNPWLAKRSVQHPYVLNFPQIFQTPRQVFPSHLFPTFLPSSATTKSHEKLQINFFQRTFASFPQVLYSSAR
jgi:hypothetical protein